VEYQAQVLQRMARTTLRGKPVQIRVATASTDETLLRDAGERRGPRRRPDDRRPREGVRRPPKNARGARPPFKRRAG
jgi:16S rRNA C967 or C1407 C5-methylase (RsmB/RsmF family)